MALQIPTQRTSISAPSTSAPDMEYASAASMFSPKAGIPLRARRSIVVPVDELTLMLLEFKRGLLIGASPMVSLVSNKFRRDVLVLLRKAIIDGLHGTNVGDQTYLGASGRVSLTQRAAHAGLKTPGRQPRSKSSSPLFRNASKSNKGVHGQGQAFDKQAASATSGTPKSEEYVQTVSHAAQTWSFLRYREVVKCIRSERRITQPLGDYLEGMHWAIIANEAANSIDGEDQYADAQVWQRFCIDIQGRRGSLPPITDPSDAAAMILIREEAIAYFAEQIQRCVGNMSGTELVQAMIYLLTYSTAETLVTYLFPRVAEIISEDTMRHEVMPKLLLACATHNDRTGLNMMRAILVRGKQFVTPDVINSVLEYSAHLHMSDCGAFVMEHFRDEITVDGTICAMLAASGKGNDRILAILEVFVVEHINKEAETSPIESEINLSTQTGMSKFQSYIAPFIYVWIGVAAYAGHAKHSTITNLIEFHQDTFRGLMEMTVRPETHRKYVRSLFHMACRRDHWNIVWSLIENQWMPSDVLSAVREAVALGHQKILHILLESLLVADNKILTPSGAIPVIFRKTSVLRALPLIAKRFPGEVSWFLDELSHIPIPGCVPRTQDHDPAVQARLVRGICLGKSDLKEIIRQPDPSVPPQYIWDTLSIEGQLRRAGSRGGEKDVEIESVICMAPETLITEQAIHDSLTPSYLNQTNALIRLISTGEESIILSPVTQALMEYHWRNGYFWLRYSAQMFCVVCFIASCSFLFHIVVVQQKTKVKADSTTLMSVCASTLIFSFIFLAQEFRQFLDQPFDYIQSLTNMMDLGIHVCVIYVVFQGAIAANPIPVLLMSIVLLLCGVRLLLHLRILPSIGPLVRITVLASVNVAPILIPMSIMALAFTGAFFLVQNGELGSSHWNTIWITLQYVVTMITYDYTMLDEISLFEVFFLRMSYHVVYIIFFINVIIALMTVNIADISSNTTAAWLVEVAELMVELELYWPYPMKYSRLHRSTANGGGNPAAGDELMSMLGSYNNRNNGQDMSTGSRWRSWWLSCFGGHGGRYTDRKETNMHSRNNSTQSESEEDDLKTHDSNSSLLFRQITRNGVILYTGPRANVVDKNWWTEYQQVDPQSIDSNGLNMSPNGQNRNVGVTTTVISAKWEGVGNIGSIGSGVGTNNKLGSEDNITRKNFTQAARVPTNVKSPQSLTVKGYAGAPAKGFATNAANSLFAASAAAKLDPHGSSSTRASVVENQVNERSHSKIESQRPPALGRIAPGSGLRESFVASTKGMSFRSETDRFHERLQQFKKENRMGAGELQSWGSATHGYSTHQSPPVTSGGNSSFGVAVVDGYGSDDVAVDVQSDEDYGLSSSAGASSIKQKTDTENLLKGLAAPIVSRQPTFSISNIEESSRKVSGPTAAPISAAVSSMAISSGRLDSETESERYSVSNLDNSKASNAVPALRSSASGTGLTAPDLHLSSGLSASNSMSRSANLLSLNSAALNQQAILGTSALRTTSTNRSRLTIHGSNMGSMFFSDDLSQPAASTRYAAGAAPTSSNAARMHDELEQIYGMVVQIDKYVRVESKRTRDQVTRIDQKLADVEVATRDPIEALSKDVKDLQDEIKSIGKLLRIIVQDREISRLEQTRLQSNSRSMLGSLMSLGRDIKKTQASSEDDI